MGYGTLPYPYPGLLWVWRTACDFTRIDATGHWSDMDLSLLSLVASLASLSPSL